MRHLFLLFFLLPAACMQEPSDKLNGYVEGEYVYIAPAVGGILEQISVKKGDDVTAGQALLVVTQTSFQADVESAKAALEKAYAQYANLTKGKRPEEIKVILKQQEQTEAVLRNASQDLERTEALAQTGNTTLARLDAARAAYKEAKGKNEEVSASLKTAMLGAREDEIRAARSEIDMAKQNIIKAEKLLNDTIAESKVSGKVEDVFYRIGEYVGAGTPVLSILPPENIKIRFFVSQAQLPQIQTGKKVSVSCDGCSSPLAAKISFISSEAEFTPPIIYSVESRQKLVFMVEAELDSFSPFLHPGLPVDLQLEDE